MPRPFPLAALPAKLQNLKPAQARFCLNIARFLRLQDFAPAGRGILVAFSGGADSTALLLALHYLAPGEGFFLVAAHLDHGLRPSSAEEAARCAALCQTLDLPFVSERQDIHQARAATGRGVEEEARHRRYAFFHRAAQQRHCDALALGHNANDLAEDILMRLMRGAGWPALSGMPALDAGRQVLRPLLHTPRADIEAFLQGLGLGWITDESNQDPRYLRNRVRHTILPLFLEENPDFLDAATGLHSLGLLDKAWLDSLLPQIPDLVDGAIHLPANLLRPLAKPLRLRLYKRCLETLGPGQARLDGLLRLDLSWEKAARSGSGEVRRHQFPGGKSAGVSAAGILWER